MKMWLSQDVFSKESLPLVCSPTQRWAQERGQDSEDSGNDPFPV